MCLSQTQVFDFYLQAKFKYALIGKAQLFYSPTYIKARNPWQYRIFNSC